MSFSIILSVGAYGGFYIIRRDTFKRICIGYLALTFIVPEFDEIINKLIERGYLLLK